MSNKYDISEDKAKELAGCIGPAGKAPGWCNVHKYEWPCPRMTAVVNTMKLIWQRGYEEGYDRGARDGYQDGTSDGWYSGYESGTDAAGGYWYDR